MGGRGGGLSEHELSEHCVSIHRRVFVPTE